MFGEEASSNQSTRKTFEKQPWAQMNWLSASSPLLWRKLGPLVNLSAHCVEGTNVFLWQIRAGKGERNSCYSAAGQIN